MPGMSAKQYGEDARCGNRILRRIKVGMFSVYKKRVMGKYDIYTGCPKRISPATRKQMTPYLLPASYSCANFEYQIFNV